MTSGTRDERPGVTASFDAGSVMSPADDRWPGGPEGPVPSYRPSGTQADFSVPLDADFGPGFQFQSEDGEFQLQIHQETQVDYRKFVPDGTGDFGRSGFAIPRARIFFTGRLTRPLEYMFSVNRGFGNLDLLDAWINLRPDERLQLKLGRIMTPFNYEQFAIQNMWLIAPERSLFTSNLGLNRQLGAMARGIVLDRRVDYAIGLFDGPRNSYEDFNSDQDIFTYLNARPFQDLPEGNPLRFLNVGGSFVYGMQDNPLVPRSFRTAANASNAGTADRFAPPFLIFDDAVVERGQRTFWSAHLAYFYRGLSLLADYNGAVLRYARDVAAPESAVLPAHGYGVSLGYFLTGEEVERRTIVEPLRPFRLRRGEFAPGAFELVARYTTFDIDSDVFAADLADASLWSNRAWSSNLGFNWYPNRYLKLIFDWQRSEFGDPVFLSPGRTQLTSDLFWFRFQFYF